MTASARETAVSAHAARQEADAAVREERAKEQQEREAKENEEALDIALSCPLLTDWFPDVVWALVDHRGLSGDACVIRSVEPEPIYLIVIRGGGGNWRIEVADEKHLDTKPPHRKWLVGGRPARSAADVGSILADRARLAESVADIERVQAAQSD